MISSASFESLLSRLGAGGADISTEKAVAVAVSGGGDSLALSVLLSEWCAERGIALHALTVDHGLRVESGEEARFVGKTLKPLGCRHKILKWEGEKPKTRLQESARAARYALMTEYCRRHKIRYLFVAHHGQDQMETILFRMAKGTGLDGLIGMRPIQTMDNGLTLLRPLLSVSHSDLLDVLRAKKINWVEDESNKNNRYARVRIRNILEVLEKEGLSVERIDGLSSRVTKTINLIDYLIEEKYKNIVLQYDTQLIEIKYNEFLCLPIEGKTRILRRVISDLRPDKGYPARLEDIERLAERMNENFRGATLGGCKFQKKKETLIAILENS